MKCAHVYRTRNLSFFSYLSSFELLVGTVQSTRGVGGCDRETLASATCSLQLAKASAATLSKKQGQRRDAVKKNKASAATLPQQEENDSADVQRGGVNISGFLAAKVT